MMCKNCKAINPTGQGLGRFTICMRCKNDVTTGQTLAQWSRGGVLRELERRHNAPEPRQPQGGAGANAGQKHDQNKPRWDLTPWAAQSQVVQVLTFGAQKYGDDNWRQVPNAKRRYTAAALRHIVAWLKGERTDGESGLHHLAHAICCLLFLLELTKTPPGDE